MGANVRVEGGYACEGGCLGGCGFPDALNLDERRRPVIEYAAALDVAGEGVTLSSICGNMGGRLGGTRRCSGTAGISSSS